MASSVSSRPSSPNALIMAWAAGISLLAVHLKMAQDQCVIDSKRAQHMSRLAIIERIKTMPQRLAVNRHDRHRFGVCVRLATIQQGGISPLIWLRLTVRTLAMPITRRQSVSRRLLLSASPPDSFDMRVSIAFRITGCSFAKRRILLKITNRGPQPPHCRVQGPSTTR